MKAIVLTLSCSLLLAGMVGMVRGGSAEPARATNEGAVAARLGMLRAAASPSLTATSMSVEGGSGSSPALDWLPEPQRGRVLAADETVRVIPLDVWRAALVMSDANRYDLLRITACETGGTWDTALVGAAGEEGVGQVIARYWGAVPSDLRGQFEQIDRIYTEQGSWPWTTRFGCPVWSAE